MAAGRSGDASGRSDRPAPRAPRSAAALQRIQTQNRRREYLHRHPSYLQSLDHELADPVLYERLVKRFQGVEERNREGKEKGYGRVLEADLLRGEARLAGIQPAQHRQARWDDDIGEGPWHQQAVTSEQGLQLWRHFLQERFVRGGDDDFDYGPVDDDEDLDVMEHREREEAWFEAEEPRWHAERQGETGIQDF